MVRITATLAKRLAVELLIAKCLDAIKQAEPSLTEVEALCKLFNGDRDLYERYREASSIHSASE